MLGLLKNTNNEIKQFKGKVSPKQNMKKQRLHKGIKIGTLTQRNFNFLDIFIKDKRKLWSYEIYQ